MNPDFIGPLCIAASLGVCAFRLWKRRQKHTPHTKKPAIPSKQDPELIPGLLTLHQAYEGVLVMGGTGSGKTTGPGEQMARALLALGGNERETGLLDPHREAGRTGSLGEALPGGGA